MECPFAEAGCTDGIRRQQLENHMTTSLQQHLMLLMIDHKKLKINNEQMKREFYEVKAQLSKAETELNETKLRLYEAEARLTFDEDFTNYSGNKLKNNGDSVKFIMPKFSEYRHSGKVWHSPPFYYREGYKMCLAVYANGVGEGVGTHVSVVILHLRGEYDHQLKWPMQSCNIHTSSSMQHDIPPEVYCHLFVCCPLQRPQAKLILMNVEKSNAMINFVV